MVFLLLLFSSEVSLCPVKFAFLPFGMQASHKKWEDRDHSLFVGYAPYDAPRFAVGTIVEHGGSGSGRAAEITRSVLQKTLELDGLIEPLKAEKSESNIQNSIIGGGTL